MFDAAEKRRYAERVCECMEEYIRTNGETIKPWQEMRNWLQLWMTAREIEGE